MRWPHIEFSFNGLPVGFFDADVRPSTPGIYGYEPYRGPGHYELGLYFEKHGYAECQFVADGEVTQFRVIAIPGYGKLSLDTFRISAKDKA